LWSSGAAVVESHAVEIIPGPGGPTILAMRTPATALWTSDATAVETLALAVVMTATTVWILRRRTRARQETAT
jgi:hypothetical protein